MKDTVFQQILKPLTQELMQPFETRKKRAPQGEWAQNFKKCQSSA